MIALMISESLNTYRHYDPILIPTRGFRIKGYDFKIYEKEREKNKNPWSLPC